MSGADPSLPRRLMVPILMVMGAFGCRGGNEVVCPATPLLCPAALPIGGTPCSGSTPVGGCEYGDDPWYDCDTIATCDPQSGWIVQATVDGASCPTRLPPECPPTFVIAQAMAADLSCSKLPPISPAATRRGPVAATRGSRRSPARRPRRPGARPYARARGRPAAATPEPARPGGAASATARAWSAGAASGSRSSVTTEAEPRPGAAKRARARGGQ
jgi:hypothetical protein